MSWVRLFLASFIQIISSQVIANQGYTFKQTFTQKSGTEFLLWSYLPDPTKLLYFMTNNCGIQFETSESNQPVITRDEIVCQASDQRKDQQEILDRFKKGALSVRGDRSVLSLNIQFPPGYVHYHVQVSMDVLFFLPLDAVDAIFKVYYDQSSRYFFMSDCGFFTSDDKNKASFCNNLNKSSNVVRVLQINTQFEHPCDNLNLLMEFVVKWNENSSQGQQRRHDLPFYFMTNLEVKTFNQSNFSPITLTGFEDKIKILKYQQSAQSPFGCVFSFPSNPLDFNLFSTLGVTEILLDKQYLELATIFRRKCCDCMDGYTKSDQSECVSNEITNIPSVSDVRESIPFFKEQNESQIIHQITKPTNPLEEIVTFEKQQNTQAYTFTYHVYCSQKEFNQQFIQNTSKSYLIVNSSFDTKNLQPDGYILDEDCTPVGNKTCWYKIQLIYNFDVQYLEALVNHNFEQIFAYTVQDQRGYQVLIYNNGLVRNITYELIFHGDQENDDQCSFNIDRSMEIKAVVQDVVPSVEHQTVLFRSAKGRGLKFTILGQIKIIGFRNVTFHNIKFDIQSKEQQNKAVAILIKPMSLDATFIMKNISVINTDQMRVMQLKFILDEFQGQIVIYNLYFNNLQWLESHSFIEFSQSNRFLDKLFEALSYKSDKQEFYNLEIMNVNILRCRFDTSFNIFTLPTTNIKGIVKNIRILESNFEQSSSIFTSFASIEPTQVETLSMNRYILISDIIIDKCNFTDNARIFSVSLQKVIPSKKKYMSLEINYVRITLTYFYEFTSFFFNDHSYFDIYLANIIFKRCLFVGSSSLLDDRSDKVSQERITQIVNLTLDKVVYQQSSLLFSLQNRNFKIINFTYIDMEMDAQQTKGTLISISNFKTSVYLDSLFIFGMQLHDSLIRIDDQVSTNYNFTNEIIIQNCEFNHIKFTSQSNGQAAGSTVYIYSIRKDLIIDFSKSLFNNLSYSSSIFNSQLSPSIVVNAFYSFISLKSTYITNNNGSNTQGGVNIIGSSSVSVYSCNFHNNSYGSSKFKGSGGHLFAFTKNLKILDSNFSYSNASHGGAIAIEQYIKDDTSIIDIDRCTFSNGFAIQSSNVGDGGAILISFNVDQSSETKSTKAILSFRDNKFQNNSAESGGGAIQIIPNILTNISIFIKSCKFIDNYGLKALSIDITHNTNMQVIGSVSWNLSIFDSIFMQNLSRAQVLQKLDKFVRNNQGRQNEQASYYEIITQIHFSSAKNTIFNLLESNNIQFEGLIYCSAYILEVIDTLIFKDVQINRARGNMTPIIYIYDSSLVQMEELSLRSYQRANAYLSLNSLVYDHLLQTALIIIQNSEVFRLTNSQILNNYCYSCVRGIIALLYVQTSQIVETLFEGNSVFQGGSLAIEYFTSVIQVYTMTQGLTSVKYQLDNQNSQSTSIESCKFFNNTSQKPGAALYAAISQTIKTRLIIEKTNMSNPLKGEEKNQIWIIGDAKNLQLQTDFSVIRSKRTGFIVQGCESGYYFNSDKHMCIECEEMTYTLKRGQFQCNVCPIDKANSCYRNIINLKPGFWRENAKTDKIYPCTYADLCIGNKDDSNANVCQIGHSGALCMSCDLEALYWNKSYSKYLMIMIRSSDRVCVACDVQAFQVMRTLIILAVVFTGMTIAVNSTVRNITLEMCIKYLRHMNLFVGSRYRDALFAAVYLKILATHFIVVTLVINMDLPIPSAFVGIVSGVGSPLDQMMLSQDCFLTGIKLPLPSLYFRVFMSLLYPFGFYMIFVLAKYLQSGFMDAPIQRGTFTIGALFVVVYMQPNLFQIIMGIISCTEEMDSKSYVTTNTNYQCYDQQYYFYFYYFSMPLLLLTTFFVPMGLLLCIFLHRNTFDTCKTRFRFGYLTLGYDDGDKKKIAKFWEIVVIYKKIATLALLNYFQGSSYNQGLLMLFTLLVYFMILKAFNPFKSEILNNTDESITLLQCYIMIIALILDINRSSEAVIYIGLLILTWVNAYAIYFLFIGIFEDFKQDFNSFMSKYYYGQRCQYIFPCFANWFKQRKVSTNRVQHLWKTAYNQIISWRKKYIELTDDNNENASLEAAFNIAAVHNIDHKQIMNEYMDVHTTAPHESPSINFKEIQSESNITSISQINNLNHQNVKIDLENPMNENQDVIEPHQFSFTQEALNQINNGMGIYYENTYESQVNLNYHAKYMGTVRHGENFSLINILIESLPQLQLIRIERQTNMNDVENRAQCFLKQGPLITDLRLDNHMIAFGNKIYNVDIPSADISYLHPLQLSPYLLGYPKKKPVSSVYKRVRQNMEHNSRSKVKLMKLTSRKFFVDRLKFVALMKNIPTLITPQLSLDKVLKSCQQFGIDLSYTLNSVHRYNVNLECTNKDENLSLCITLRHTGGPALLPNHLKDQKRLFVDPLERFLEIKN